MKRYQSKGIVLKRINYAEADRILTFFTPKHGKVTAIAKGVRKPKSKLAGGIELFSVCDLSLIHGKGSMETLVSTRLDVYFENIIKEYDRLEVAYDVLKITDALTDDDAGEEYYDLLESALRLLDEGRVAYPVVLCWFIMQSLRLNGTVPNLLRDDQGNELLEDQTYGFSVEDGTFFISGVGTFTAHDIKAWRVFVAGRVEQLTSISGLASPAVKSSGVLKSFIEFQM